jgi:predicted transcriptional regulator
MKITKEQIERMKVLKAAGIKQNAIALELGITQGVVSYYIGNGTREKRIKSSIERFKGLSQENKKKVYQSRKEYIRNYMRNRYKNDSVFREKIKERNRN